MWLTQAEIASLLSRMDAHTHAHIAHIEVREKCIRKKWKVYTEVYIVFIFVYLHVILPYLVSTLLLDSILLPHLYYAHTTADKTTVL